MNSTVTHNTANENGNDGIAVGQKSLVSHNVANDNGGDGIEAVCPATVTDNQASGNGELNFNFIGEGCFDKGNTSPDNDPVQITRTASGARRVAAHVVTARTSPG